VFIVVYFVMTQSGNFWIHPRTDTSIPQQSILLVPSMRATFSLEPRKRVTFYFNFSSVLVVSLKYVRYNYITIV